MLPDLFTISSSKKLNKAADILAQVPGSAVVLNVWEGLTHRQERLKKGWKEMCVLL